MTLFKLCVTSVQSQCSEAVVQYTRVIGVPSNNQSLCLLYTQTSFIWLRNQNENGSLSVEET